MVKPILNPSAAKLVFQREAHACGTAYHSVGGEPRIRWRVTEAIFPIIRAEVRGPRGPVFWVRVDCTNYDYDPPSVRFEDWEGNLLHWDRMAQLGRHYMHRKGPEPPGGWQDIVSTGPDAGFICVPGNMGYHEAHGEDNWRAIRRSTGRLYFVIENAVLAIDLTRAVSLLS